MNQTMQQKLDNKSGNSPEINHKSIKSPSPEESISKEPARQDYISHIFSHTSAMGGAEANSERFSSLLTGPGFSHPANSIPRNQTFIQMQQTFGNHYVQRMVEKSRNSSREPGTRVQAKLKISPPNDRYEEEADRIAEQVMRMPEPKESLVKRKSTCPECLEEEEIIQTKPIADQITPLVQRQTDLEEEEEENLQTKVQTGRAAEVTPSIHTGIKSIRGGGQPLPESVRSYFEPRFGIDFSQVRVHTNPQAASAAKSLNARAFTSGKDIVFGDGKYLPESSSGKHLLAHELAHVVQQQALGKKSIQLCRGPDSEGTSKQNGSSSMIQDVMKILMDILEHIASVGFSIYDERIRGEKEQEAAIKAFKKSESAYNKLVGQVGTSINEVNSQISELESASKSKPLSKTEELSLQQYKMALTTLKEMKATKTTEEWWNKAALNKEEQKQKELRKKLINKIPKVRKSVQPAIGASYMYFAALGEYLRAKNKLRDKLIKMGIYNQKKGRISRCVTPKDVIVKLPETMRPEYLERAKDREGWAQFPYVADEGACTIGYGHVINPKEAKCVAVPGKTVPIIHEGKRKGTNYKTACTCKPPLSWGKDYAGTRMLKDIDIKKKWIEENVHIEELDQEMYQSFLDLALHRGSLPPDLLKAMHEDACDEGDNERLRQLYLKAAPTLKGTTKIIPGFKERREEEVWPER